MNIKLGQKVHLPISTNERPNYHDGTIIYINPQHRYFMVLFILKGGAVKECYKF